MDEEFAGRYHQSSKNPYKGHSPVPESWDDWPDEWKTTYYKSYPRFPTITLPDTTYESDLFTCLRKRETRRDFSGASLSPEEYSALLQYGTGIVPGAERSPDGRFRRAHPSAGIRFPIETYAVVFHGDEQIPSGLYHYDIRHHRLVSLWDQQLSAADAPSFMRAPWIDNAAVMLVHTAVFWRTQFKYGERGYRYALIEAGHISQNMHLVAEALGIKCCALGGTNDTEIEKLLDIDGNTESIVYATALGK